jgi:CRP/FNR family cyclic AMP-dependent transcriptional regulator
MPADRPPHRSPAENIALLKRQPLFADLSEREMERLISYAKSMQVASGTTLFSKGDAGTALYAIRSGTIKINVPGDDGREAVFNLMQDGDVFGEIALLDGQARTADAVATSLCDLVVIERRDFLKFVEDNPKVALKIIALLCARLRWTSEHLEEAVLENLQVRLARALLRLVQNGGKPSTGNSIKITQQELSHLLGATRESVNRQLRAWETQKLITLDRGAIVIHAIDRMADLAKHPTALRPTPK